MKSKRRQPARLLGGGALLLGVAGAHAAMNGKPVRSDNRILRGSRIEQKQSSPLREKIVQTVEDLFGSLGKNINDTKEVLRLYGNMSSATV